MNSILITILIIGVIIVVHELGHYIAAKAAGVRVDEFAVGMGPKIFGIKHGETDYSLRAIPLGGYVRMAGMDPEEKNDERGFNSKTILQRMVVIFAGSFMNFLLAIVLFIMLYSFIGINVPVHSNIVGQVVDGYPAERVGLQEGDQLTAINGETVNDWTEITQIIQQNLENSLTITVQRDDTTLQVNIVPEKNPQTGLGMIGIRPTGEPIYVYTHTYPFWEGVIRGTQESIDWLVTFVNSFVRLITGQASVDYLAGPVGIVQMTGEASEHGFRVLLWFAALLSLNIGFINLLPIPFLDGSRLVFLGIEGVRGKPLDPAKENLVHLVGFALLIILVIFVTYNDILRILN